MASRYTQPRSELEWALSALLEWVQVRSYKSFQGGWMLGKCEAGGQAAMLPLPQPSTLQEAAA